jgi:hypothetical protein
MITAKGLIRMSANWSPVVKMLRIAASATFGLSVLAVSSCADPTNSGVVGRIILVGRVPHSHGPYVVGAVSDGKIVRTAHVDQNNHYMLRLPPGRYIVGVWSVGMPELTRNIACTVQVRIVVGSRLNRDLRCVFH